METEIMPRSDINLAINEKSAKKRSQWNEKIAKKRTLYILTAVFAATILLLVLVYILTWTLIPRFSPKPETNVCQSQACIKASAMLLRNMNLSADPCDDFYNYACGGINRIPYTPTTIQSGIDNFQDDRESVLGKQFELLYNDKLGISEDQDMNEMHKAVRDMFKSCVRWHDPSSTLRWLPVNTKSQQKPLDIKVVLEPIIKLIDNASSVEELLAILVRTEITGFIKLDKFSEIHKYVAIEDIEFLKKERESGPVLIFRTLVFYFESEWNKTNFNEIENSFQLCGINITNSDALIAEQNRLFQLRNLNETLRMESVTDLSDYLLTATNYSFNLANFIKLFYPEPLKLDMTVAFSGHIDNFVDFVSRLAQEFATERGPAIDIVRLSVAISVIKIFSTADDFKALKAAYTVNTFTTDWSEGSREYRKYTNRCITMAMSEGMSHVALDMFKRAYITDNFTLVNSLATGIQDAMMQNVNEEQWIQSQAKQAIIKKLKNMKRIISYNEIAKSEIKQLFKPSMKLYRKAKNFGDFVIMNMDARLRMILRQLTSQTPLHQSELHDQELTINAFYHILLNSMHILTGILESFMYNREYPAYLLFGAIGSVIGHEMGHAFGPEGIQLNENGDLANDTILDGVSKSLYHEKSACLAASYQNMTLYPGQPVNGNATLGENFADIVGINAVFRAYRQTVAKSNRPAQLLPAVQLSKLSADRLFFIESAQFHCKKAENYVLKRYYTGVHSPPRPRVLGMTRHSQAFDKVFQCKAGDAMFLPAEAKCQFW